MPFPLAGLVGAGLVGRAAAAIAPSTFAGRFVRMPVMQGGQFGIGYTGGSYAGYGFSNTVDPFNIHKPKYKYSSRKLRMAYGMYGYGRYRRRYSRFRRRRYYRRYSSYGRYRRRYY